MGARSYFMLEDFGKGVDVRKTEITAPAGTLRVLDNGFVNAGGEIEKRRRLSLLATVSSAYPGLAAVNNTLYVFGTDAPGSVTIPAPLQYAQLIPTGGVTVDRILDADVFQSKFFVIARMSDGSVRRFYDGVQVTVPGGIAARTYASKVYLVEGSILRFSAVNDPDDFLTGTGAGFIDVTTQEAGSADLLGIERYYDLLALLGRRSIQLWSVDPDPDKSQIIETLENTGLVASQAVARYGNGDVMFLTNTGVRSIRARDSSNSASLTDIGSPIDPIIIERRLSLSESDAERLRAIIDPMTGHFWLVWGSKVYVLAQHTATRVSAWSMFDLPYEIDYAVSAGSRVAIRSGDQVYIYGGFTSAAAALDNYVPSAELPGEYDATSCVVETPFLDLGRPATTKIFTGLDCALQGTWKIEANFDPLVPGAWSEIGTFSQTTYSHAAIPVQGQGTHVALRLTSIGEGRARVGALALHFQSAGAE
jgi:hypothetical protein